MNKVKTQNMARLRRANRVRAKITGTAERPRLSVFKSNLHLFAQIINDETGQTLVSGHTKTMKVKGKMAQSEALGHAVAEQAKAAGITRVAFDRGANRYHGRIKALADGARAGGLEF